MIALQLAAPVLHVLPLILVFLGCCWGQRMDPPER